MYMYMYELYDAVILTHKLICIKGANFNLSVVISIVLKFKINLIIVSCSEYALFGIDLLI